MYKQQLQRLRNVFDDFQGSKRIKRLSIGFLNEGFKEYFCFLRSAKGF